MTPEMQSNRVRYTGTKTLFAWPMTRGEYNAYRTWTPPHDEDQTVAGYLVEYEDGGAANDSRHVGYISWSPADVFERTYHAQNIEATAARAVKITVSDAELPNRGPRVTPAHIEAEIASEHYFSAEAGVFGAAAIASDGSLSVEEVDYDAPMSLRLLTLCVLVLKNGFTVTGEAACASPANFDADIGQRIARQAAVAKVWPLLGFRLRDLLADDELAHEIG